MAAMERGPQKQGRLLNGFESSDGRLEVFTEGDWYSVSTNNQQPFTASAEAETVCSSLGYRLVAIESTLEEIRIRIMMQLQ